MKFPRGKSGFIPQPLRVAKSRHSLRDVFLSSKSAGFTLVESLIVIAVMMVISAMLLSSSKSNQTQLLLSTSQATVAGVLGNAKSLALAKWTETSDPAKLPCGFGVNFNPLKNTLIIYQDLPALSGSSCDNPSHNYGYVSGEEIQTIGLDPRLEILPSTPANVVFVAPYLKTLGAGTVALRIKNAAGTAKIEVTAGGSITSL